MDSRKKRGMGSCQKGVSFNQPNQYADYRWLYGVDVGDVAGRVMSVVAQKLKL